MPSGAFECSKGEQAPQTPLEPISRCAVSVVDTLVYQSLQEGVVEWLELVRLELQGIVLPIKEETVDALTLIPCERVQRLTAENIWDVPQFRKETVKELMLVPRERVQQLIVEQIANWSRDAWVQRIFNALNGLFACVEGVVELL